MHIKDHSAAMKFFRTYDNVASKGKWKEFVDEMAFESMVQEPQTMAQGGRIIGKPGGLVEPGIEYYGKTKWVAPNIQKTKAGSYEIKYKAEPQVTKKTLKEAKAYLKSVKSPHAQTGVKKSKQHIKALEQSSALREKTARV